MEKKKVRRFTKWIALAAVFAMVVGMSLVAYAATKECNLYYNEGCDGTTGGDISAGDTIMINATEFGTEPPTTVTCKDKNGNTLTSSVLVSEGSVSYTYEQLKAYGEAPEKITYNITGDGHVGVTVTLTNFPVESEETSSSSSESEPEAAPHTHSFEWTVDYAATMNYPGKMSYRCTTCGKSLQEKVLPIENYYVDSLYLLIRNTGEGNTVTYDAKDYHCIFDSQIKALAERPDVSVKINFTYEGKNYTMTIPSGRGYTDLLSDDENCYGYFNFANLVGGIIAER